MINCTGGDLLMLALKEEEVDTIFGYPGGSALHIYDAIYRQSEIRHILVRHEQAATHAADGYSRSTGKPGVVLVTSGPGATNAITGIATAYMDSIPMIVISGQVPSDKIGEDAFQETDMMGISRPIVKHSFSITDPNEIPLIVKQAFHIATTGRPGPVVIDIPKNMSGPSASYTYSRAQSLQLPNYKLPAQPTGQEIQTALDMINQSARPIIYAGGGIVLGEASEELREFAFSTGFPVTLTLMGLGAFPADDEQFIGMVGMHGTVAANRAMHHSDLIIALGVRFDDRVTNKIEKFCPNSKVLHVDIDPTSISKIIPAHHAINSSVKDVLTDLNKSIQEFDRNSMKSSKWWQEINEWRACYPTSDYTSPKDCGQRISPQHAINAIYKATKGDAFVTSDVGQHQMFAAQHYKFHKPNRWINSGGLGTMGFGLPAALGVKIAHPDELVICVTGEGSIQMCIQELSTLKQYNLPVMIFCLNNESLGMVKQWQDLNYESRYSEISYGDSLPDFTSLAKAYGHEGICIQNQSELEDKLAEAMSMRDKVVFVEIQVTHDEHVYPMQIVPHGSIKDIQINKEECV
ncbi:biosynthetic-type acetolactate synthase large subunit [Catenovulum sp. 2E275]|uniref:biosynthetic-type acetolactate synthase large subunit n=1 Tax=Catenovulum sp. 2E275 TaxID=2980497 RepID=UPI0021D235E6|nr:biosynthetic-type acetolactate synthase large subunit [Catenovulum sp. 2E275]MCU4677559.1 biosynthetic-type acetolactate synthase large subunit [Catenovulum sp. 2E275]